MIKHDDLPETSHNFRSFLGHHSMDCFTAIFAGFTHFSWENPWNIHGKSMEHPWTSPVQVLQKNPVNHPASRIEKVWQVQQKVLNAEGKEVLRDVAFELNDLNDGKTEVQTPSRDISGCS